jgi:hypothetical protein
MGCIFLHDLSKSMQNNQYLTMARRATAHQRVLLNASYASLSTGNAAEHNST